MLPTCIGISGVSRYRNDASIEDSFLASPIFPPARSRRRLAGALRWSLLVVRQDCAFSGGAYAMANGPDRSNCLNWPSGWARRSATAHKAAALTAEPDMAGEVDLDVLGGIGRTHQAGPPVHDAVGARIDRSGRHRQVAGDRLSKLGIVLRPPRPTAPRRAASRWSPVTSPANGLPSVMTDRTMSGACSARSRA